MRVTKEEALRLLRNADLLDLGERADKGTKKIHVDSIVTFVVDRNINYTNVCINKCRFYNARRECRRVYRDKVSCLKR